MGDGGTPPRVILREPERSDRRPKDRFGAKAVENSPGEERSFVAPLLRMTREGMGFHPHQNDAAMMQ